MITGATRGTGQGHALAGHLLKEGNNPLVVPARGLGSETLAEQVQELVAQSAGGRTDRPIYHVFCSPDPIIADVAAARARFWALFEAEFGLGTQPYCGVEHRKDGRLHEHRAYSLVRPTRAVISLSWDFVRREKCSRIVEFEFGLPAVASKFARLIERRLRLEGRFDVADWLVASGTTTSERPVARLTPRERQIGERTGTDLDDVRRATLAAWREAVDGPAFVAALQARGLDLREGRVGAVVVDGTGTAHLATRVLGAAARRFEGDRIPAAAVHALLADLELRGVTDGIGDPAQAGRTGTSSARAPGRLGTSGRGERIGLRRPCRDVGRPDERGGASDGGRAGTALDRLRSASSGRRAVMVGKLTHLTMVSGRYLAATERARKAIEQMDEHAHAERARGYALWGKTDIWGLPLQ